MYTDHRTATSLQHRRTAELRHLAARRRASEDLDVQPAPERSPSRFSLAWFVALVRPRHA